MNIGIFINMGKIFVYFNWKCVGMGSNDFIDEFFFVGYFDVVMGVVVLKDDGLCERFRFF